MNNETTTATDTESPRIKGTGMAERIAMLREGVDKIEALWKLYPLLYQPTAYLQLDGLPPQVSYWNWILTDAQRRQIVRESMAEDWKRVGTLGDGYNWIATIGGVRVVLENAEKPAQESSVLPLLSADVSEEGR